MQTSVALRGRRRSVKAAGVHCFRMSMQPGPLMRMTAMAPCPAAVACAAMVRSGSVMVLWIQKSRPRATCLRRKGADLSHGQGPEGRVKAQAHLSFFQIFAGEAHSASLALPGPRGWRASLSRGAGRADHGRLHPGICGLGEQMQAVVRARLPCTRYCRACPTGNKQCLIKTHLPPVR